MLVAAGRPISTGAGRARIYGEYRARPREIHICYGTMSLLGADVIRLRDSNKDLRLGDFVSRVKLAWNREHVSNRKTAIDGRMHPAFDPYILFFSFLFFLFDRVSRLGNYFDNVPWNSGMFSLIV